MLSRLASAWFAFIFPFNDHSSLLCTGPPSILEFMKTTSKNVFTICSHDLDAPVFTLPALVLALSLAVSSVSMWSALRIQMPSHIAVKADDRDCAAALRHAALSSSSHGYITHHKTYRSISTLFLH